MVASYYAWDPEFDCITKETDAAGAVTARYTQEPKLYGGLISQHRSGASSFYHYDAIGTTRALTNSGQAITDTAVYTAFGERVASVGSTVNSFGFVGEIGYLEKSGQGYIHVRARDYSTAFTRWVAKDPISGAGSLDVYRYCENSPTSFVDPSGLKCYVCNWHHFVNGQTVAAIDYHFESITPAFDGTTEWYNQVISTSVNTYSLTPTGPLTSMSGVNRTSTKAFRLSDGRRIRAGQIQRFSHGSALLAEICASDGSTIFDCKIDLHEDIRTSSFDPATRAWVDSRLPAVDKKLDCFSAPNVQCGRLKEGSRFSEKCKYGILIYDEPTTPIWVPETLLTAFRRSNPFAAISVNEVFQKVTIDDQYYQWRFVFGYRSPQRGLPFFYVKSRNTKSTVDNESSCC